MRRNNTAGRIVFLSAITVAGIGFFRGRSSLARRIWK